MKKRILLLLIILFLSFVVIWIMEPLSLIPWKEVAIPEAKSEIELQCEEPHSVALRDFERQANELIDQRLTSNNFLGVSAGVYMVDCAVYKVSAGFMDKGQQKRANNAMLSRIASVTKPMTAIAIMQLYEKGELDLDEPIETYIQEFSESEKGNITVRQLLKHTSGIPHYASKWEAMSFTNYSNLTETLEFVKEKDLAFQPGTQYLYSSYGYTLLGVIVERVSSMSYEDYLQINVWDKAGMSSTSFEESDKTYGNKSKLYLKAGSTFIRSPKTDLSLIYPAGGVQSTAEDLLKFGKAILENKLVEKSSLEMMINATDEMAPSMGDDPYGFGWAVYDDPTYGRIIQHGGAQPGCSSFFSIYLDHRMVIAVLSNSFGTRQNAFSLSRDMAQLAIDKLK